MLRPADAPVLPATARFHPPATVYADPRPLRGVWAARAVASPLLLLAAVAAVAAGEWSLGRVSESTGGGGAEGALMGAVGGLAAVAVGLLAGAGLVLLWLPWGRLRMR